MTGVARVILSFAPAPQTQPPKLAAATPSASAAGSALLQQGLVARVASKLQESIRLGNFAQIFPCRLHSFRRELSIYSSTRNAAFTHTTWQIKK